MKKKQKTCLSKKVRNSIYYILILILLIVFAYSAYQIISYIKESLESKRLFRDLSNMAVELIEPELNVEDFYSSANNQASNNSGNSQSDQSANQPTDNKQSHSTTDTDAKKETEYTIPTSAPIKVDFDLLRKTNSDIVAWLYCANTKINYPVAQGEDNSEYLYTLLNGSYNRGGTLFMDYTNQSDFSDWNTLIYGHNMKNDSMFGTLTDYNSQKYYDEHPIWFLLTPNGNYYIELISGYVTDIYSEIYHIPQTMEQKDELVSQIMRKSTFATKADISSKDRLITFSTCTYEYDDARYVLIGILKEL